MKILQDLDAIIDFRKINVLGQSRDDIERLFELIRAGKIKDTASIREHFFPGSPHGKRYTNNLKRQLRRRMVNTAFCTDPKEKNYWEIYFDTAKKALVCELLWNNGKSAAAAQLAEEVALEAEQYEFPQIGLNICRQLCGQYSVLQRDRRKFRRFRSQYDRFSDMDRWIQLAEMYYYDMSFQFRHLKSPRPEAIQQASAYNEELAGTPETAWSLQFVSVRTNFAVMVYRLKNDIAGILTTCEAALQYFNSRTFAVPGRALRSVYFSLVAASLQTEAYDKAGQYIDQVKPDVEPGGHNWIGIHQYQTILAFRRNDLALAAASINILKDSKHHQLIGEEIRIYETYLALLTGEQPALGRFLNETIHFSTDKKGMNINILILQVLIFLRRDDRPAIIERLEALQMYAYRYLANDPVTRRSELFFRLLFLLARSIFDPDEARDRSPDLLQELRDTPRHISAIDIEVVPYEGLWEWVLGWV